VVALGAFLVVTVRAPERPVGEHAVRGHRVFRVARHAVRALDVTLGERRFSARRAGAGGSSTDGPRPRAPPRRSTTCSTRSPRCARSTCSAAATRARTGSIDRTRRSRCTRRAAPAASSSAASTRRAARSTPQRRGDPRVLLVGTLILTEAERVFYAARTVLASRDRVVGLADAARAAAERATSSTRSSVSCRRPAEEEAPPAEHLDAREASASTGVARRARPRTSRTGTRDGDC
jgi:hypothetical protein